MNDLLSRYQRDLALRGYSPRTQDTYFRNIRDFLSFHDLPPEHLDSENIKNYLYSLITERNASDSKIRQAHGAIKYLYAQTLQAPMVVEHIPQVKKKKKLPTVFSFQEIISLFNASTNLKHQTMLMLVYSSGLRVSEIASIIPSDIKRKKMQLLVRQGKGAKDRYTILSDTCLDFLEKYWLRYRPGKYMFPGRNGNQLSIRA